MKPNERFTERNDYLKRLPAEYYRGKAYVHWSMTMQDRKTGWLVPIFYYKFREILTHTTFRFGFCCPIYCCMPDHIHLLWAGLLDGCDQRLAARYFRKQLNPILEKLGARLQEQGYDHVLQDEERDRTAFEEVFDYVARNPERAKLVKENGFRDYPYTGCLVPGYPELRDLARRFLGEILANLRTPPETWPDLRRRRSVAEIRGPEFLRIRLRARRSSTPPPGTNATIRVRLEKLGGPPEP